MWLSPMGKENFRDTRREPERRLAGIESDLLNAESSLTEAENKLRDAQIERDQALEKIIFFQDELDTAIASLRSSAPAGSKWGDQLEESDDPLDLGEDLVLPPESEGRANPNSLFVSERSQAVSKEFEKLRQHVNGSDKNAANIVIDN